MPTLVIGDTAFTPQEAADAIMLRDWLAGEIVHGHACPSLDGMSGADAAHWLATAVINAKKQREKHATRPNA